LFLPGSSSISLAAATATTSPPRLTGTKHRPVTKNPAERTATQVRGIPDAGEVDPLRFEHVLMKVAISAQLWLVVKVTHPLNSVADDHDRSRTGDTRRRRE